MVSPGVRFKTFTRDNFTCQYCGRSAPEVVLEIDHKLPLSKGGKHNLENLVTACRECNRGKADIKITPNTEDFFEQLKQYDKEFNEVLERINRYKTLWDRDVPCSLIQKARNKKIKKFKYMIEYLENQKDDLSKQHYDLKYRCIASLPTLKSENNLEKIINFEIYHIYDF